MTYVALHTHSEFSILDGLSRVEEIAQFAADNGQPAVALTDHGVLYGAIRFYEACQRRGVVPILGCELYVAPRTIHDRDAEQDRSPFHLVVLAENDIGWRNLVTLVTRANAEGYYYKPRVDHHLLAEHSEGLIVLSGCLGSELAKAILAGDVEVVERVVGFYRETFPDRYFLEMQDHGQSEDAHVNDWLLNLQRQYDLPLVATQDSHYTKPEDKDLHDTVLAIQTGQKKHEVPRKFQFQGDSYHLTVEQEMLQRFPAEAVSNTGYIAECCHVTLPVGAKPRLPKIGKDANHVLWTLCTEALAVKYADNYEALTRLYYEYEVITSQGFADYFLMVASVVKWAREHGVAVGPGRGSAGGSIVAYLLDITRVDPLKYGLVFERFMTLERVKLPDIDLDFDDVGRKRVLESIESAYGSERVAQVCTLGTFQEKAGLRSVASALELDPTDSEVISDAERLKGIVKSIGKHAAGVVISPEPLQGAVPLMKPVGATSGTTLQTGWEMDDLGKLGYLKLDVLGIARLSTIQEACKMAGIEEAALWDFDDPLPYRMLGKGDVHGVFQLDSWGGRKIARLMQPKTISELAIATSLDRPGPMKSGMFDLFVARRQGREPVTYEHPELEPVLSETLGCVVFQEQVMQIAQRLAGYSLGEADLLREAMGKKIPEKMAAQREKFTQGCTANGITEDEANSLFDMLAEYAGYAFNKSHGTAYAILAFQTAWLKAHYPIEWYCALMNERIDVQQKLVETKKDAMAHGIRILPPHIYESGERFCIAADYSGIRPGLTSIPHFGKTAYVALQDARRKAGGQFVDLRHMLYSANMSKLNKGAIQALIKAGAMSCLGNTSKLLKDLEPTLESVRKEKELAYKDWVRHAAA